MTTEARTTTTTSAPPAAGTTTTAPAGGTTSTGSLAGDLAAAGGQAGGAAKDTTKADANPSPFAKLPEWARAHAEAEGATAEEVEWFLKRDWKSPWSTARSVRSLEGKLGPKAEDLLVIPKEGDAVAEKAFWQKVGVPETAEGYKLQTLDKDGDPKVTAKLAELALKNKIPAKSMEGFAADLNAFAAETAAAEETAFKAKQAEEQKALEKKLGNAYREFVGNAAIAANRIGLTAEQRSGLEAAIGYSGSMELLHLLGGNMREGAFYGGTDPGEVKASSMDPVSAEKELKRLEADDKWMEKWLDGDPEHVQKRLELQMAVFGSK